MKITPVLFSPPMVRALLNGEKTQTRRVVKGVPLEWLSDNTFDPDFVADPLNDLSPYGYAGDLLWVRESLYSNSIGSASFAHYKADNSLAFEEWRSTLPPARCKWRWQRDVLPSIHMPRAVSRLTLRMKSVRIERLQDITDPDSIHEGAIICPANILADWRKGYGIACFRTLWESINGKNHPWDRNPWVWVNEFEVLHGNVARFC